MGGADGGTIAVGGAAGAPTEVKRHALPGEFFYLFLGEFFYLNLMTPVIRILTKLCLSNLSPQEQRTHVYACTRTDAFMEHCS